MLFLICGAFLAANDLHADQVTDDKILVEPSQAVVQVNGIVCSFCAFGAEKNLSKLSFLDESQFGGDGVLIDIQLHRVTLALQSDQQFNFGQVYSAIKKGGYDPVSFYINVYGQVQKDGERYLLISAENGQVFEILGTDVGRLVGEGPINVTGQVDADRVATFEAGQPVPLVIASTG
jgi:hypothetical protein